MHLGKLLVPVSRFEFWKKAMDILGLGYDNLIALPIDGSFKTDTEKMRSIVYVLLNRGTHSWYYRHARIAILWQYR